LKFTSPSRIQHRLSAVASAKAEASNINSLINQLTNHQLSLFDSFTNGTLQNGPATVDEASVDACIEQRFGQRRQSRLKQIRAISEICGCFFFVSSYLSGKIFSFFFIFPLDFSTLIFGLKTKMCQFLLKKHPFL